MQEQLSLKVIAHIENDFPTKFGIPRQSGMVPGQRSVIVFEEDYRDANALRGIEGYSHLWLIWGFSEVRQEKWSPMVKPPRLGGNTRMGVFATRSPYRPNPIGLSSVALKEIVSIAGKGRAIVVEGADLMDGTPIYDIKPYLSFTDSHPDAKNGFAAAHIDDKIEVDFPGELLEKIPQEKRDALIAALALDPRPSYQEDPELPYGMPFAEWDVRFCVKDGVLRVFDVVSIDHKHIK